MRVLPVILLLLFLINSCATTERYEAILASWVGNEEEELINSWGVPRDVYHLSDEKKIITYVALSPLGGFLCKTSFTIDKGKVVLWRWQGHACTAR